MIRRILVANRGEIARRVFRTCRDLGIGTVAVHSDADADAPFVAEADVAVRLPGDAPADTYLRSDPLVAAALSAGADAVHPGYGFLSENAEFARAVVDAGLTWIGPTPATIEAMGSKVRAKDLMREAGVPVLDVDPDHASEADLPLLVKASSGGGGRGMRVVRRLEELTGELEAARSEAASAFGDGTVFVEPYLPGARHVEVQVLADTHGTIWILGDRDCSIQRRHQKVVEEAPAPGLAADTRSALHDAARAAAGAVGYAGAGTVEFLLAQTPHPGGGAGPGAASGTERAFFLEMNTRLQVEHPVTELVHGVDLVAWQIAVAEGRPLEGPAPEPSGHAVEVRLYAEDASRDWAPQTGRIRAFEVPTGHGLRVDSAVEVGSVVGHHYDPMIAKVVAHGPDRPSALRRLDDALRRMRLHGLVTNRDLLRTILTDGDFQAVRLSTALLEERIDAWTVPLLTPGQRERTVLAGALASARAASTGSPVLARIPTAFRNVPSAPRERRFLLGGEEVTATYAQEGDRLVSDVATIVSAEPGRVVLSVDGVQEIYDVVVSSAAVDVDGPHGSVDLTPIPSFVDPADVVAAGSLVAPMPATVVRVDVEPGNRVAGGDVVLVLEAMKMQHVVTAPADGVVTEIAVVAGDQVVAGAVLAVIEADEAEERA